MNWAKVMFGLGLLWFGVLRGAKGLVIRINNYQFRSVNLSDGTIALTLNISIKNPLIVGLTIKGIKGTVYAQGTPVGTVNTAYNYYLAGGKTHILPVIVDLNMGGMLNAASLNIQSGDVKTITVAFDGKIYVGNWNVGVPLQLEMDYDGLVG